MTFRVETTAAAEQDADAILDWLVSQHVGKAWCGVVPGAAGRYHITWGFSKEVSALTGKCGFPV